MKNIPITDILFILISGGIVLLINEFGFHHNIVLEILAGYFTGKYVERFEQKRKLRTKTDHK